jgi:hypothetical protein
MDIKKVWETIKKQDMPKGSWTIKYKWIIIIKRNQIVRARLVACGYSQVLGVDFNESFTSVINDASLRIMMIAKLIWELEASIIDDEIGFLHG